MTKGPPPAWSLIEGDSIRRAGSSPGALVAPPDNAPEAGFEELLRRLQQIDPLAPPGGSALAQMRQCAARARQIIATLQAGLTPEKIAYLVSTYEAAILAGFSDLFYLAGIHKSGPFREEELEAVGSIGWWHGDALRQRWCDDSRLTLMQRSSTMLTSGFGSMGLDDGGDGAGAS